MKYFLKRSIAYLIDCMVAFSISMLLLQLLILAPLRDYLGFDEEFFKDPWNMEFYVLFTISLPVWLYFSFFEASSRKAAIGKMVVKMKVLDIADNKINFGKSFFRTILKLLPWEIAHIGIIFPEPIYYMEEPNLRILSIVGLGLMLVYMISIGLSKKNQTFYDYLLGTKVT